MTLRYAGTFGRQFWSSCFDISVAKGLFLKNATNLPNHAKNHATKKTLKRSHIFGQRRHNFDQLKIFSIAFFSPKIRNCRDLGKRRHNLSWRRHKSDIFNQIIKRRHIFELWRVHATSNFMAPQGGPKTPLWRDHATFGDTDFKNERMFCLLFTYLVRASWCALIFYSLAIGRKSLETSDRSPIG